MKTYLYLFVMALTTYLIRVLPLTLIRKPIRNRFLRSFLYYVPYVTLAVMTFPAIMTVTQSPIAGAGGDARRHSRRLARACALPRLASLLRDGVYPGIFPCMI